MNPIQKIVDSHAIKALFTVKLVEQGDGKITLRFKAREDSIHGHQGVTGLMIDCAARAAGYSSLGQSFLSECETSIQPSPHAREFIAYTNITWADNQCATFYCDIYSLHRTAKTLVAESQGTLSKAKPALARVA
ncbi:MAG: hypothetical protein AAGC78_06180 [Cellvibrio sp.]|uniref:hypothetical protein n=1 Tax=Cellvibrio sp. TaxID=1965322 RepID=UPI0031AED655